MRRAKYKHSCITMIDSEKLNEKDSYLTLKFTSIWALNNNNILRVKWQPYTSVVPEKKTVFKSSNCL